MIGIVIVNENGEICFTSEEFCTNTEYLQKDLDGKDIGSLLYAENGKNDKIGVFNSIKDGVVSNCTLSDKTRKPRLVAVSPIKISIHDKGTYYICALYDAHKVDLRHRLSDIMNRIMHFLSCAKGPEDTFSFACKVLKTEMRLMSVSIAIKQPTGEFEVIASSEEDINSTDIVQLDENITAQINSTSRVVTVDKKDGKIFLFVPLISCHENIGFICAVADRQTASEELKKELTVVVEKLSSVLRISARYQQMQLLGKALSSAVSSVFITDTDGIIVWANKAFTEMSKYTYDEILNKSVNILKANRYPENLLEYTPGSSCKTSVLNRDKFGALYTVQQIISPMYNGNGEISNYVFVQNDVMSDESTNVVLNQLQRYDSLTNLPNRALFKELLAQKIKESPEEKIAVICIDMARFHTINDTMGRIAGDRILKKVSDYIGFIASPEDILARLGGDNFGLALSFKDKKEIYPVLKRISGCVAENNSLIRDTDVALTASIGVSVYPDDSDDVSKLLDYADMAVHKALSDGVPYYIFCKAINEETELKLRLERDLRRAVLRGGEFVLYYQPQVSMSSGALVGWEALIRWIHPELGLIPPLQFIPLAEETELILPIGEWALRNALKQWKKWHDEGYPSATVAVNISAVQFKQENIAQVVNKALREEGVPPENLELELTETVVMHDTKRANKALKELSDLGVKISIDDFGTGYSSLSCLKNFPVDKLKIDRSFISDLEEDSGNVQIAKAIIQLGHILGLEVISEGVETQGQLKILKENGCDSIQGYYFGKPMSVEEIPSYLKQKGYIK